MPRDAIGLGWDVRCTDDGSSTTSWPSMPSAHAKGETAPRRAGDVQLNRRGTRRCPKPRSVRRCPAFVQMGGQRPTVRESGQDHADCARRSTPLPLSAYHHSTGPDHGAYADRARGGGRRRRPCCPFCCPGRRRSARNGRQRVEASFAGGALSGANRIHRRPAARAGADLQATGTDSSPATHRCPVTATRSPASIFSAAIEATQATDSRDRRSCRRVRVPPRIVAPGPCPGPPAGGLHLDVPKAR